jgi:hypothetical protein
MDKEWIPGEVLGARAIVWEIYGQRKDPRIPIPYGKVPGGMREERPPKPLEEGGFYLIRCSQNENGGCTGATFIIENGQAVRK